MTDTAEAAVNDASVEADPLAGHRIVSRTILRPDQELDIRPLYVGGISATSATDAALKPSDEDDSANVDSTANPTYHESGSQDDDEGDVLEIRRAPR